MPSYQGHLIGGAVTFLAVRYVTTKLAVIPIHSHKEIAFALSFCLLGSLFPDIDTKSFGQRIFYSLLTIMVLYAIVKQQWSTLSILSLISLFPLLVNHRGIIHRVWFVTLVPLIIPLLISYNTPTLETPAWAAYIYFVSGALSHLLLDYGIWQTIKRLFFKKR